MRLTDKLRELTGGKHSKALVLILGAAGLLLILLSSLMPGTGSKEKSKVPDPDADTAVYCIETEQRLEGFLSQIEGAGRVRVYLTVGSGEQYVYAKEAKSSRSENKTEEEEKYVMTGGGSEKNALIETVRTPEITGAVIACTGCGDPAVTERIYRAASAALGIPTGKIYVTTLE